MKVTSAIFTSFSGSIGGAVAAKARGGIAYLRARIIPSNPRTTFQSAIRGAIAGAAAVWSAVLSQVQRDAWDGKATGTQTGQTLYSRTNVPRLYANGTDRKITPAGVAETAAINRVDTPPTSLGAALTSPGVVIDAPSDTMTITWNTADAWYTETVAAGKNAIAMIYVSPPQSPSRGARQFPYQLAACLVRKNGGTAMSATLDIDLAALGMDPLENDVMYVKVGVQQSDGSVSIYGEERVVVTA